jgi:hypothetical protein
MLVSTPMTVIAAEEPAQEQQEGSKSITADDIQELKDEIGRLSDQIKKLTNAVRASHNSGGGSSGSGSSNSSTPKSWDNYVDYGGNIVYQAGKIELNGGKSNVTFTIKAPGGGTYKSALSLASNVGGSLINCINTSTPGIGFKSAKVNFFCTGVTDADNIAVYQNQDGKWVQIPVVEIRKDHVIVLMSRHGDLAFIRVPALATITG